MPSQRLIPVLLFAAVLLAAAPLAAAGDIDASAGGAPPTATLAPEQSDSALGGLAAIGCGIFVRATIVTGGTQVGTIVGAVACCGLMLFDALTTPDDPR